MTLVHNGGGDVEPARSHTLVIEILSPGDKSLEKLPFYAAHRVGEVLIVDPVERKIDWLTLDGDAYRSVAGSALIDLTAADLAARLDWS